MEPQAAIEAPRVASYSFPASSHPHPYAPGLVRAEGRLPAGLIFRAASAGPPPDEPVPAHAPIEGEDLAARYRALLDRYAVGARPEPAHPRAAPVE